MILVTLGTQDKSFKRILEAIEKQIVSGVIKERVVVQAGFTKYESKNMEIFDYIDRERFANLLGEADLIITHGGVGTIMTALSSRKKIIAVARLSEYGEHHNDHQTQILESFEELGYLYYLRDFSQLAVYIERIKNFEPRQYQSNTQNMIQLIEQFVEKD